MEDNTDEKYVQLALKLKQSTENVVCGFDENLLLQTCNPASPEYDASLDLNMLSDHLFLQNETWSNRALLKHAVDAIASVHGWQPRIKGKTIRCNRFGEDKTKRNYTNGSLHQDCTFCLTLKPTYNKVDNPNGGKALCKEDWSKPVLIKEACCKHGGLCTPGRENRVIVVQRAAKYVNNLPTQVLYSLCNVFEFTGRIDTASIKNAVRRLWPKSKNITKSDVFNLRVKVKRCLKLYRDNNGDYDEFKKIANASELLKGVDNWTAIDDDEACALAQEMWLEIMHLSDNDDLFSFTGYAALDMIMMKRGINTILWPHVAVSMYNELRKICVGCEGIVSGEKKETY